jgi:class 3 adenylate cyclase
MPLAYLVLHPGRADERCFPVADRIFVGRECPGIDDSRRVLIEDAAASRTHFEIRLDLDRREAYLVDTSTNGTRINGSRVGRAVPHPLKAGDWMTAGDTQFAFRSSDFTGGADLGARVTLPRISASPMAMVVGDITNYTTISQVTASEVVAQSLQLVYEEIMGVLAVHRGTLSHYAGDAIYAVWESDQIERAGELAVDFALAASRRVAELAPSLPLRAPDGSGVHMGWAVVHGLVAVTTLTHATVSVVGDATNLAFRLSGLAGRGGRSPVLASSSVHAMVRDSFRWGAPEQVDTKGRTGQETVYPILSRA